MLTVGILRNFRKPAPRSKASSNRITWCGKLCQCLLLRHPTSKTPGFPAATVQTPGRAGLSGGKSRLAPDTQAPLLKTRRVFRQPQCKPQGAPGYPAENRPSRRILRHLYSKRAGFSGSHSANPRARRAIRRKIAPRAGYSGTSTQNAPGFPAATVQTLSMLCTLHTEPELFHFPPQISIIFAT
jgi:hypothetical protein